MTSNCTSIREFLALAQSRTLDPADQEKVSTHLASCAACRSHRQALEDDHQLLAAYARSLGARQARMEDAVMTSLETMPKEAAPVRAEIRPWARPWVRWAAAAVVLAAVLGGVTLLDRAPTTSVAWAQVIARVEAAQDYICRVRQESSASPDLEMVRYCSGEYGLRHDMYANGRHVADTHVNPATGEMVVLVHRDRKYSRLTLPPDQLNQMLAASSSAEFVRGFKELDFKEIGLRDIEGRTASGIETEAREIWGGVFDEGRLRLWVDIQTQWPVLVEFEGKAEGGASVKSVYDRMQWNAALTADDFAYEIPADYISLGDVGHREINEESAIEGLRSYSLIMDGRFPRHLVFASAVQELQEQEPDLRRRGKLKDGDLPRLLQIRQSCLFFEELKTQGRNPVYRGDRVTARDFDQILLAWELENGDYRLVYGDLRVVTLSGHEARALLD